jgi:tight adherence protein B
MTPPTAIWLTALIGAAATAIVAWLLGTLAARGLERWRSRFEREAELEFAEMLYQMPGSRYTNLSLAAAGGAALVLFLGVSLTGSRWHWQAALTAALGAFAAVLFGSRLFLRALRGYRLERFNDQLEESLMSMSNALKAGFSIVQAIEMIIRQNRQPISVEFSLMVQQTRLGMTFDDALRTMSQRVRSEDFDLVASAIRTARITGGDLTGIFDRLAALIRERRRIQRRILSLTAQGRLQGRVLGALPLLLLGVLFFLDPTMVRDFFAHPVGLLLFLLVLTLEVCGFLVIRRMVNIDI